MTDMVLLGFCFFRTLNDMSVRFTFRNWKRPHYSLVLDAKLLGILSCECDRNRPTLRILAELLLVFRRRDLSRRHVDKGVCPKPTAGQREPNLHGRNWDEENHRFIPNLEVRNKLDPKLDRF